jgi:hypothetical protein
MINMENTLPSFEKRIIDLKSQRADLMSPEALSAVRSMTNVYRA